MVKLYRQINGSSVLFDQTRVDYLTGANAGLDGEDALKPSNFTENLSVFNHNKDLIVERRPIFTSEEIIQLRLYKTVGTQYEFEIGLENFSLPTGMMAVLEDRYLNTRTPLSLSGAQRISFTVNNDPASSGDRFRIVFRPNTITPVTNLNGVKAMDVYPNPIVKGGSMQLSFTNREAGKYTVTLYTIAGVQMQQLVLTHGGGNAVQTVQLASGISTGTYIAEITDMKGEKERVKVVVE
jgi:hypothetical protein